jgi:hypothetical protein
MNIRLILIIGPPLVRLPLSYTLLYENGRKGWFDDWDVIFTLWKALFCIASSDVTIL